MRILIASTHQSVVGGVETYLQDLIPALLRRGHEVALLASAGPELGTTPIQSGDENSPVWCLNGNEPSAVFRDVLAWKPDVAYSHGLDTVEQEASLVENLPTVLFAHGHLGTCVSGTRTHAFPSYRPCDKQFGPACLLHYLPRRCGGLNPLTMIGLYRQALHRADLFPRYAAIIVGSRFMLEEYRRQGILEARLHCVPLFPTGTIPDSTELSTNRSPRNRVLMVGRLYKLKGAELLVEAMSLLNARLGRKVTLVIAGEGPERLAVAALAARLDVPTEFHGWVDPNRRAALMLDADVLALPSVCPETFGLVGVEAGSLGVPSVAFALGGILDWLIPGQSGELASGDPPTAAGLADALTRALANPAHLHRLSEGALHTARRFSREAHVLGVETILTQAVARACPALPVSEPLTGTANGAALYLGDAVGR